VRAADDARGIKGQAIPKEVMERFGPLPES